MNPEKTTDKTLHIGSQQLLALVRQLIGARRSREDDEHPLPPGPWEPVVRKALEQATAFSPHPDPWHIFRPGPIPHQFVESVFGPHPDPWKAVFTTIAAKHPEVWEIIGGEPEFGSEVALNPQPLPPRLAFLFSLVRTVVSRAELLQDIAHVVRRQDEEQSTTIGGGYVAKFTDDICGNDIKFKWPFPGPRPIWYAKDFNGVDLIVIAALFDRASFEVYSRELHQELVGASKKLAEFGLAKT